VVGLSLRAWAPAYASLERVLGPEIFRRQHPDWREDQRRAVRGVLAANKGNVWVTEADRVAVGFVAIETNRPEKGMGEISMLGVDPDRQGAGIGTALTLFALERLVEAGMGVAMVETGGRPRARPGAARLREGRLRAASHRPLLQEPVAARGRDAPIHRSARKGLSPRS
jgi:GNAT superfamily N-acetyltransferase